MNDKSVAVSSCPTNPLHYFEQIEPLRRLENHEILSSSAQETHILAQIPGSANIVPTRLDWLRCIHVVSQVGKVNQPSGSWFRSFFFHSLCFLAMSSNDPKDLKCFWGLLATTIILVTQIWHANFSNFLILNLIFIFTCVSDDPKSDLTPSPWSSINSVRLSYCQVIHWGQEMVMELPDESFFLPGLWLSVNPDGCLSSSGPLAAADVPASRACALSTAHAIGRCRKLWVCLRPYFHAYMFSCFSFCLQGIWALGSSQFMLWDGTRGRHMFPLLSYSQSYLAVPSSLLEFIQGWSEVVAASSGSLSFLLTLI